MMSETVADLERPAFMERHYTCPQLAKEWNLDRKTVYDLFKDDPEVIKIGEKKLRRGRKEVHITLRIPEHVAKRVYEELKRGKK